MTTEVIQYQAQDLALPDAKYLQQELAAVKAFQQLVHQLLIKDQDYGVIPGTQRPTLLKPGAEKISKLLGLTDHYTILEKTEDWERPFFRYITKCELRSIRTGVVISECIAECNSWETRYRYRWVSERDIPKGVAKATLVQAKRTNRKTRAEFTMYRIENEDIYSQVNTLIKMADKRALVGATLSAGRLSDIFTQDMEDLDDATIIEGEAHEAPSAQSPDNGQPPTDSHQPVPVYEQATNKQREAIRDAAQNLWGPEWSGELTDWLMQTYQIEKTSGLTGSQAKEAVQMLANQLADRKIAQAEQKTMAV